MSAPHKLPDGSWSDGVGRGRPIAEAPRYSGGVQRACVFGSSGEWWTDVDHSYYPTHAEAIAIADKLARQS